MYGGKVNKIHDKGNSVIEYALVDEPNLGARPRMEDSRLIL